MRGASGIDFIGVKNEKVVGEMRTNKAIKNAFFSVVYQIVMVVCGLITPRLILSTFGSAYNGVISSANQFLEMISFLTLGIAGATRVALYRPLAEEDITAVSRIIKSNKRYMHKVGLAIIAYTLLLCIIYPLVSHNNLSHAESAILIATVSVGVFSQYYFGASNQTLLSADQSGYIYYIVQSVASIANTAVAAILIKLGFNIFVVKLGSAVVFLISPIILNLVVQKKYSLIRDCEPDDSAIKNRGAVAFHSIANIVHDDTDLIVLTLFADAKLISVYSVYQLIAGKIRKILLMLTNGLEGAFGNMWVKKEIKAFERNFRFFEYMIFAFTSIVFSSVLVLIIPFIELYTKGVNDINYIRPGFAALTVVTEAMYCVRHPYLILVQATGNYEATKKDALLEALINIALSLILVNFIGINGVMIGTLVANTFRTVRYAFFISGHIIPGSIQLSARRFLWFIVNSGITVLLQLLLFGAMPAANSWGNWVLKGFAGVGIAGAVTVLMSYLFYRQEFFRLLSLIKKILSKFIKR